MSDVNLSPTRSSGATDSLALVNVDGKTIVGDGVEQPLIAVGIAGGINVDGTTIGGDASPESPLHVIPLGLSDKVPVLADGITLVGNGTTGLPLTVITGGGGGAIVTDGVTLTGFGTIAVPASLLAVQHDGTLTGTGTPGSHLGVVAQSVAVAVDGVTIEGDGTAASALHVVPDTVAVSADGSTIGGTGVSASSLHVIPAGLSGLVAVDSDGTTITGNGTNSSHLQVRPAGLAGLVAVDTNGTLTGDGTSGAPLAVVAGTVAVDTDGATISGNGTSGSRLAVILAGLFDKIQVAVDGTTVSGNGTTGSPLAVIPGGLVGVPVVSDGVTVSGNGTTATPLMLISPINVKSAAYGAIGNGTTDDRAAIQLAIAAAITQGRFLYFPPGQYKISKYLDFTGMLNSVVFGEDATILYPSADSTIPLDPVATALAYAESAFFMRYTQNVLVKDINFRGQDSTDIHVNLGSAVYGRYAVNLTVQNCHNYSGGTLFKQDTAPNTTGIGLSLAVAAGIVTITNNNGSLSQFHNADVGRTIQLAGCTNLTNDGAFQLLTVISATQATFANAAAIAETSSFQWSVDNGDTGMRVSGCTSFGAHGTCFTGNNAVIDSNRFEQLMDPDLTGLGDSLTLSGTTVTLFDQDAGFTNTITGKYILISGATSPANNGLFQLTYVNSTSVSWTNAAGVSELGPNLVWYIQNGERVSIGSGASAITNTAGVTTFVAATGIFVATDVNKTFRPVNTTTQGNAGAFRVLTVVSATTITYNNVLGVTEAFAGQCAIDSYDQSLDGGNTYGTSHAIYLFGGRQNVSIINNTFIGIRTTCMKISGSSGAVMGIKVRGNTAIECAPFGIIGADDSQEHDGIDVSGNYLLDCGTQRVGWNNNDGLTFYGCRNVSVRGNHFHYTHNNIIQAIGLSLGGQHSISATRLVFNASQPLEAMTIEGNIFTANPRTTTSNLIVQTAISIDYGGVLAKWNVGATPSLTRSGNIMTLNDPLANFLAATEVGESISFVNATNVANNITSTILTVVSATQLTFTNASGVAATAGNAGTYRIAPARKASAIVVANNSIVGVGYEAMDFMFNNAIEVHGNTWVGSVSGIRFSGDCTPRAYGNREVSTITQSPRMRIDSGTSWPVIYDNHITNPANDSSAIAHDIGISVDANPATDYPLLGKSVRARPSNAQEEIVFAYGSLWVDGDTVSLTAGSTTVFTYKGTAPGALQFNSFASLLALFNAVAGFVADDYGTAFAAAAAPCLHLRIRKTAQTSADGTFSISTATLNPHAGVLWHDQVTTNAACSSRGAGTLVGGVIVPDKTVVWSPLATFAGGGVDLRADNTAARTLLASGSPSTGSITCVAQNLYAGGDTDFMTIGDGILPAVSYGFSVTGNPIAGKVEVNISAATTAASVAALLRAAILANQPSLAVVDLGTGVLTVTQNWFGPAGNVAMTENVANAGFLVSGLAGGTIGSFQLIPNQLNSGCCALVQHGRSSGTEEFRAELAAAA